MTSEIFVVFDNLVLKARRIICMHCGREIYVVLSEREQIVTCPHCAKQIRVILTEHGYIMVSP